MNNKAFQVWNDGNPENEWSVPYRSKLAKLPTHKVLDVPSYEQLLMPYEFVKYEYPLPRDYGQINGHSQRTAEPVKIALVNNDYEWQTAVANWLESSLYLEQPFGLELLLRQPRLQRGRSLRLHYARFLLPLPAEHRYYKWYSRENGQPIFDRYESPFFTAFYVGSGENKMFISDIDVDVAYNAEPVSWNSGGKRAHTIPTDWLSNRIDENKHKYDLFA
jgi:hypothetical protein